MDDSLALHLKYRPTNLDEVFGNEKVIAQLEPILSRESGKPHVFLFSGPSGCGKTTFGRIIKNELKCSDRDFKELNIATDRGIKTVRDFISNCKYAPMDGPCKIYLLDECFAKGSLVNTPSGVMPIEAIQKGNQVYSLSGIDTVLNVFKNRVALDRIVRLKFSNGLTTYSTREHLFFTNNGWKKSIDLQQNDLIFGFDGDMLDNITSLKEPKYEKSSMSNLQEQVCSTKAYSRNLFKVLWSKITKFEDGIWDNKGNSLRRMWNINGNHNFSQRSTEILFSNMCRKMEESTTKLSKNATSSRSWKESKQGYSEVLPSQSKGICNIIQNAFRKNEKEQSIIQSKEYRKSKEYKKNKWNLTCLARRTWRKWKLHTTSNAFSYSFGMANGSSNIIGEEESWISNKLQSGYRQQKVEIGNRIRWERSQIERCYLERSKENNNAESIRMESIEVYKRGSNDRTFSSVIGDKERDQGFVEFYDLEVENHPSYFVNNLPVHNCHKLTGDAKDAILKILEDTPSWVYFVLCTTEPQKLLVTIKTRCTKFKVESLKRRTIIELLKHVLEKEGVEDFPEAALKEISRVSNGSPREALVTLDSVIDIEDDKMVMQAVSNFTVDKAVTIDLCRALIAGKKWTETVAILKDLEADPESVRYAVLNYMNTVILGSKKDTTTASADRAAVIIALFEKTFSYSGKAGLTLACYLCLLK